MKLNNLGSILSVVFGVLITIWAVSRMYNIISVQSEKLTECYNETNYFSFYYPESWEFKSWNYIAKNYNIILELPFPINGHGPYEKKFPDFPSNPNIYIFYQFCDNNMDDFIEQYIQRIEGEEIQNLKRYSMTSKNNIYFEKISYNYDKNVYHMKRSTYENKQFKRIEYFFFLENRVFIFQCDYFRSGINYEKLFDNIVNTIDINNI